MLLSKIPYIWYTFTQSGREVRLEPLGAERSRRASMLCVQTPHASTFPKLRHCCFLTVKTVKSAFIERRPYPVNAIERSEATWSNTVSRILTLSHATFPHYIICCALKLLFSASLQQWLKVLKMKPTLYGFTYCWFECYASKPDAGKKSGVGHCLILMALTVFIDPSLSSQRVLGAFAPSTCLKLCFTAHLLCRCNRYSTWQDVFNNPLERWKTSLDLLHFQ